LKAKLPPFSLIRDFGKQNAGGNGSKSTNHSPLAWGRDGQKVTLVAVIGGFRSDLSITGKTSGNFENVSASVLLSTKTVVNRVVSNVEETSVECETQQRSVEAYV